MKRRKTVSVTPAMGASTVAGRISTPPMRNDSGKARAGGADRSVRAISGALSGESASGSDLYQYFCTNLFYVVGLYIGEGLTCTGPWVHMPSLQLFLASHPSADCDRRGVYRRRQILPQT